MGRLLPGQQPQHARHLAGSLPLVPLITNTLKRNNWKRKRVPLQAGGLGGQQLPAAWGAPRAAGRRAAPVQTTGGEEAVEEGGGGGAHGRGGRCEEGAEDVREVAEGGGADGRAV
eukprot:991720-Prorocentrum_minimum.AAC.1